jgi:predicted esterase
VSGVRLDGLRVFLTGSDVDEWIPESRTRLTETILSALGADVRLRLYPGRPHIVSDEEIGEARALLEAL